MNRTKRFSTLLAILFLASLLLMPVGASALESETVVPKSLARQCEYTATEKIKYLREHLSDADVQTRAKLTDGGEITVTWDETVPVDFIYYEWKDLPEFYYIELLDGEEKVTRGYRGNLTFYNDGFGVDDTVRGIRISSDTTMDLSTLIPYEGGAPENYHPWETSAASVDFLEIAMHPDDDTLFMGAIMPIYGVDRGYNGTILYMSSSNRTRITEALNGAWAMGLKSYPYFAHQIDVPSSAGYIQKYQDRFNEDIITAVLVRYYRMLRPQVVMTHDTEGEYGHWQHKIVAAAAQKAALLAADSTYDPESAELYGTWQIKKLYLHLNAENPITLAVTTPLESLDGRSPWDVAQSAYLCHESQQNGHHFCDNAGVNSLADFGLVFSTVGPDTGINDMFEHIERDK